DPWGVSRPDGARHGVHRSGPALRSGRVLGTRDWRVDRRPRSSPRPSAGALADRWPDYRGSDALAILRIPCVRDPGSADRVCVDSSVARPEAGHQRMAHAWTCRAPLDVHPGVPTAPGARQHSVRAAGDLEGPVLLRRDHRQRDGMCSDLRSVRPERLSGSDDHRDGAQTGLLLPLAVRDARAAAAFRRDAVTADRPGCRDRIPDRAAVLVERRREKLEAQARGGRHDPADGRSVRQAHPHGRLLAVEPCDERVEWRPRAGAVSRGTIAARTSGLAGLSGQAVSQLSLDWRLGWHARAGAGPPGDHEDRGPTGAAGDSGGRQHAGVREEPQPGRSDRAGFVSRNIASAQSAACTKCGAGSGCSPEETRSRVGGRPLTALPASFLHSWSLPPVVTLGLALLAIGYLRGWWIIRGPAGSLLPPWRAAAFLSGLGFIWIALASPLDLLNDRLLTAHMLQHMLLMMVAPPLILLGAPLIPIVRGLPAVGARKRVGSFLT